MKQAIIGASGDMGKFLIKFLEPLGEVQLIGRKNSLEEWEKAWQADVIWLSIPRDVINELIIDKKFKKDQIIIDICSLKRGLSKVVQKTGATHLSLHPLHGASLPLTGQRWAVIPTHQEAQEHPYTKDLIKLLHDKGVTLLPAESEDHHDFMLGITLSVPELLTIVLETLIKQYAEDNNKEQPSQKELMQWAVPASNVLFSAYHHIINSTADWLRKDLVCKAHGNLLASSKRAFQKIADDLLEEDVKNKFEEQGINIKTIPSAERERIRRWIEEWFADSTKTFFKREKQASTKPPINMQWRKDNLTEIFSIQGEKIKIGIHGIEGCFTHEALLRFCEETGYDSNNLELKFLVTADNVLKAVTNGEIDRGIFAMANSGSGAYVTSMQPMGNYRYDVLAVFGMEIMQCLLSYSSVEMEDIKEVFGHPQAVSQCKRTLAESYPSLNVRYGTDDDDTALCAQWIAEGKLPKTTATLASQIAAKLYGLNILSYNMHHDPFNTTTFLIIKNKI